MAILGTPEYMAPEQADPAEVEEIDWRADVYALGVVAYEMLAGRPPFTGKSPTKVLYQHVHEPPPEPTTLNPNLPAGLGPILLKTLAKQRENRFQRAQTFAAQMRQSLLGKDQVTQQESPPPRSRSRRISAWVWIAGVAFGLLIAIPVVLGSIPWPSQKATPVPSSVPTQSPTQQATEIPTEPPIETSAPTLGDTHVRPTDNMVMVYAPAGQFKMGSDDADLYDALQICNTYRGTCQQEWFANEQPVHAVTLDGLWVDQTEVTNAQFAAFLNAKGNQTQEGAPWLDLDSDYSLIEQHGDAFQPKDGYADYPVVQVSWHGAAAYCEWVGGRLPTEAEWEYAARGEQRTVYPWGNAFDGTRLNFCDVNCTEDWREAGYNDGHGIAAPVSSFPAGASWCGALNLSGNVWEWVADWYGDYPSESQINPIGPPAGEYGVLRGGSWNADQVDARTARRNYASPTLHSGDVGFRCEISLASTRSSTATPDSATPATPVETMYGFEDGTTQGWQILDQATPTIQSLAVTEATYFSGRQALQIEVKGLSGSLGGTIYLRGTTLTRIFGAMLRLPPDAPADAKVWVQLAAASPDDFTESDEKVYLSHTEWRTIEWDTRSHGWENDAVHTIYIQIGAGSVEYHGAIYVDGIYIK
jgi:formylglycine-generating enzyme required for sulfatase activity